MATLSVGPNTVNVTVRSISGTTSSSLGSGFNVSNGFPVTGLAVSSPGESLVVQVSLENSRGDAVTGTVAVSDSSGSGQFFGAASISWDADDTSVAWLEFSDFPRQADQVTPTGECDYQISLTNDAGSSGVVVGAKVFTI
jgi:hypothetical protein